MKARYCIARARGSPRKGGGPSDTHVSLSCPSLFTRQEITQQPGSVLLAQYAKGHSCHETHHCLIVLVIRETILYLQLSQVHLDSILFTFLPDNIRLCHLFYSAPISTGATVLILSWACLMPEAGCHVEEEEGARGAWEGTNDDDGILASDCA